MVHLEVVPQMQGLPREAWAMSGDRCAPDHHHDTLQMGTSQQGDALAQGPTASLAGHGKVWQALESGHWAPVLNPDSGAVNRLL